MGAQLGTTNTALLYGQNLLIAVYVGAPFLTFVLDKLFAGRYSKFQEQKLFRTLVALLRGVSKIAYPSRLILPVKLTLQSNTRPFLFTLMLLIGAALIVVIGGTRFVAWQSFSLSGEYIYFDANQSPQYRTVFYEDSASSKDRLRGNPKISSFEQSGSYVRVFLPYHPLRDNRPLEQLCDDDVRDNDIHDCLRLLWSISIGDRSIDSTELIPAERFDLRMLGLVGVVPLEGLKPGLHVLSVTWNPTASTEESRALGDRYQNLVSEFEIPFLFNPAFERSY